MRKTLLYERAARTILAKLTLGVNFISIVQAAFAPVDLLSSFWCKDYNIHNKNWV